jgi:hypothetical protein
LKTISSSDVVDPAEVAGDRNPVHLLEHLRLGAPKFLAPTQGNESISAVCMRTTKLRAAVTGVERVVVIANRKDRLAHRRFENDAASIVR